MIALLFPCLARFWGEYDRLVGLAVNQRSVIEEADHVGDPEVVRATG
ncbi:hypothetical protein HRbin36_01371 [bacterium HR36]|nr:hypothetical protein HRbin36_01371 [bacterium HR36]